MPLFAYPENITGIVSFIQYVNSTLLGGLLGIGMLLMIFFVSFLASSSKSYERSLGFSSFITMICAVLLRFLSLINDWTLGICIIGLVGAVLLLMKERSVENV